MQHLDQQRPQLASDCDKDWRDPGYPVEVLSRPVVCVSRDDATA